MMFTFKDKTTFSDIGEGGYYFLACYSTVGKLGIRGHQFLYPDPKTTLAGGVTKKTNKLGMNNVYKT